MATILQRLKDQMKDMGVDTAGIQTISQALKKMVPPDAAIGTYQEVTGDTISECLDNMLVVAKEVDSAIDIDPNPIGNDDELGR